MKESIIVSHYDLEEAKKQAKELLKLDCDINDIVTDRVALSDRKNRYRCLCRWHQTRGNRVLHRTLWIKEQQQ